MISLKSAERSDNYLQKIQYYNVTVCITIVCTELYRYAKNIRESGIDLLQVGSGTDEFTHTVAAHTKEIDLDDMEPLQLPSAWGCGFQSMMDIF